MTMKNYLTNIDFRGYMTMAPYTGNKTTINNTFSGLRNLAQEIKQRGLNYLDLSMGMSNDFSIAIEEGATQVRVGRRILNKE